MKQGMSKLGCFAASESQEDIVCLACSTSPCCCLIDFYPALGTSVRRRGEPVKASTTGWECPRCNRVYAPSVQECVTCSGSQRGFSTGGHIEA